MAKCTDAEKDYRVKIVYAMLLAGNSRTQVWHYAADKWGVSSRTSDRYIKEAREYQHRDADLERSEWMHEALAQLKEVQRAANKKNNHFAALKALELQAKLLRFDI